MGWGDDARDKKRKEAHRSGVRGGVRSSTCSEALLSGTVGTVISVPGGIERLCMSESPQEVKPACYS